MRLEGAQTGVFKPRKAAGGDGAIATSDWTRDKSGLLNSLLLTNGNNTEENNNGIANR